MGSDIAALLRMIIYARDEALSLGLISTAFHMSSAALSAWDGLNPADRTAIEGWLANEILAIRSLQAGHQ